MWRKDIFLTRQRSSWGKKKPEKFTGPGRGAGFTDDAEEQTLYVFGEKIHENGVVITLFRGQRLKIYAESSLGWTPIGKEFTVTDIRSNNIVKSLDGELAGIQGRREN